jgi:formamidopyrimidine-DNA glycosylase
MGNVYVASQLYIADAHPVNPVKTCSLAEIASDACRNKSVQNVIMKLVLK